MQFQSAAGISRLIHFYFRVEKSLKVYRACGALLDIDRDFIKIAIQRRFQ